MGIVVCYETKKDLVMGAVWQKIFYPYKIFFLYSKILFIFVNKQKLFTTKILL